MINDKQTDDIGIPGRADPANELDDPLRQLVCQCERTDIPLVEWLFHVQEDDSLCLKCRTNGVDLFFTWDSDREKLYETEHTAEGVVLGPAAVGIVRTIAVIETADVITLRDWEETPVAWVGNRG